MPIDIENDPVLKQADAWFKKFHHPDSPVRRQIEAYWSYDPTGHVRKGDDSIAKNQGVPKI